tara:strand:- start:29787 stop:30755 length:969 start_codon:yes stop_codon:yes gene_type:complete
MTSIFSDEQRASLMDSMTNPESNARKMIEQNADIGMSPDLTTEILNKYATYGANTGIGNIGGGPLVDALNEQYRTVVDKPLRASVGLAVPQLPTIAETLDLDRLTSLEAIQELSGLDAADQLQVLETLGVDSVSELSEQPAAASADAPEDFNTPPVTEGRIGIDEMGTAQEDQDIASPTDLSELEVDSRMETFKKFLDENPLVAKQLAESAGAGIGIAVKEIVGRDKTPPAIRAPRPRFQTSRVNVPTIGKSDGGTILNRKMFLGGGEIDGPGGEKEDLVPIWASPNEYVVSADAVRRMGGGDLQQGIATLDKINFGDEQYG